MLLTVKKIFQCMLTPRLYNVHRNGPIDKLHQPKRMEEIADTIISSACVVRDVSYYLSPFIVMYLYKRGMDVGEIHRWFSIFGGLGCFLAMAFFRRGYGRATDPDYTAFITALNAPKDNMQTYLENLRKFDFEFYAWPATFVIPYNPDSPCTDRARPFVSKENEHLPLYQQCIVKSLAYIAIHTFGLRLIYPGSLALVNYLLKTPLLLGRASMVEEYNGKRVKVRTADGNDIDTMFVNNRDNGPNGKILVICSEGNSGFYEVGIMNTPIKAEYSVLGWNHPGFGGSTGQPYPRQEHCAIDAVMQYAIQQLQFPPEQIVMFGWSIGGYSAAWAACNYHTKALILDATFDDLVALAEKQMPASWAPLVREAVRAHVDLHVAGVARHYRGPLHLVRRTDDEIICLTPGDLSTNCGNDLLLNVIKHRHAREVEEHHEELARLVAMPDSRRPKLSNPALSANTRNLLRLIVLYSTDYRSTHCTPLPTDKFESILTYILDTQKKSN